jgi:hypothetical protein
MVFYQKQYYYHSDYQPLEALEKKKYDLWTDAPSYQDLRRALDL